MNEQKLKKKLNIMIVTVLLLACCLCITTFALVNAIVSRENNKFLMSMGVALNVNDGQSVVGTTDVLCEPGGRYQRKFPIANLGTFDVWYRVYLTDVDGFLKDHVNVTVKESDGTVLCSGKMSELDRDGVTVGTLAAGTEKTLTIEFYFSADVPNDAQGQMVTFNITADATQKENNPYMDFGD